MTENARIFDPYEEMPFTGYLSGASEPEVYWSLMHFLETEKLRGVDEQYRRFLLDLRDKDDFRLETAGIANFSCRDDWNEVREKAIYAGMMMQLSQNKETMLQPLLCADVMSPAPAISQARDAIIRRLASSEPMRRVLFVGLGREQSSKINALFDHVFRNRLPDEIIAFIEPGVATSAARYAHHRYIPIRTFGIGDDLLAVAEDAVARSSHVFQVGATEDSTPITRIAFDLACQLEKTTYQLPWNH